MKHASNALSSPEVSLGRNFVSSVHRMAAEPASINRHLRQEGATSTVTLVQSDRSRANLLLAALPPAEWRRLEADLEWVALPRDKMLYQTGSTLPYVYFPTSATISLISPMKDGAATEVAVVGQEGVVGVCAFMGAGPALSSALVQSAGHGWRMSAAAIVQHAQRSPDVLRTLLSYTQSLFAHLVQTSACNQHHALEQQFCRWLLLHADRQAGDELTVTQERIAGMLGVRREGITGAAVKLQKDGLIRYWRGHIAITDRSGLEQCCCECYSVIKQANERLSNRDTKFAASYIGGASEHAKLS